MDRAFAFLALFIFGFALLSGCIQQDEAEERGEPPQAVFVPLAESPQHEAEGPHEQPGEEKKICSPPAIDDYCGENQTRYYDFECVDGEWQYKTQKCAYECKEGECVRTGCPPCDDGDPCTTDLCSGAPLYECIHLPDATCQPVTSKACRPVVAPGGSITIDIYPAGAGKGTSPEISQVLIPGQRLWLDKDDFISFQAFVLEGSCPRCFYPPLMKWPPSAQLYITKDLSGNDQTYLEEEGEFGYICIDGYCKKSDPGPCRDYVCKTTMRFAVSRMDINLTCT